MIPTSLSKNVLYISHICIRDTYSRFAFASLIKNNLLMITKCNKRQICYRNCIINIYHVLFIPKTKYTSELVFDIKLSNLVRISYVVFVFQSLWLPQESWERTPQYKIDIFIKFSFFYYIYDLRYIGLFVHISFPVKIVIIRNFLYFPYKCKFFSYFFYYWHQYFDID